MVLLATAIFTKDGKALLSRQFVEMTRARIEGLLMAFPKLIRKGKQHTFIETDSVRYVYQPLEKLFVLLLTTKASNILEDLETLRLFAKVIPEYSRSLDEHDIKENIFEIIFAFDEIVALGYRENVNLAQIKTFTEMDSQEEKIFLIARGNQEKEAIENMKKKAKELQSKRDTSKGGSYHKGYSSTGFGSSSTASSAYSTPIVTHGDSEKRVVTSAPAVKSKPVSTNAMRLGGKAHVVDTFVDQLKSEGVSVEQPDHHRSRALRGSSSVHESIHVRIEEKLKIEASHESGLLNMELLGTLMLKVTDKESSLIRLKVDLGDAIQLQTHPNVDKKMFQTSSILQLSSLEKSFPVGQEIGLLRWRFQSQEGDQIPLLINCWPNRTKSGCTVNIEYELQLTGLELRDVVVSIPLPAGAGTPTVKDLCGEYCLDAHKTHLLWTLSSIDAANATGSLEFETKVGQPEDFFPLSVTFFCESTLSALKMLDVFDRCGNGVQFSSETGLVVDKYEIV